MGEPPDDRELERRGRERAEVAKKRAARARSRVKKAEEEAEAAGSVRSERAHRHEIPVHEAGAELQEAAQREHEEHARLHRLAADEQGSPPTAANRRRMRP